MSRYLSLVYRASQISMIASNLFTLPSKPMFGYVIALLSPSYSVVGCRWRLEFVPCWNMDILLGYHNISYLINASIYLVKGGRLGLMPCVLFHSCRPSFRHIGVMFPGLLRSLRGWVIMGILIKAFPAMPNLGFTICHLAFFPLGSVDSRVILF